MTTATFARIRFHLYIGLLILIAVLMPTPDPAPFFITAAAIIGGCERVFRLVRAL
jgi:hypothetical protein